MRDTGFIVLAQYLRQLAEQLRRSGVSVAHWLALNGLDETRFAEPALSVTFSLFRRLVLDALQLTGEPALGLFVGEQLVASTHGIVGFAAVNSGTVAQALEVCERFSRLRTSLIAIRHEARGGDVRVRFDETRQLGEVQRPILEAVMLSIANVLAAISMGDCRPRFAAFACAAPPYKALAQQLFGCPVRYGQSWSGLVLPREALDLPCKMADPDAFREAAAVCQRELERMVADESLAGRVRRLILERHEGVPSLTATARRLHMTERTLHRRLVGEGTSFRHEHVVGLRLAVVVGVQEVVRAAHDAGGAHAGPVGGEGRVAIGQPARTLRGPRSWIACVTSGPTLPVRAGARQVR